MSNWFQGIISGITEWYADFAAKFKLCFIDGDRWKMLVDGLGVTLEVTFFSVLLGIAIGIIVAAVRSSYDRNLSTMHKGLGSFLLKFFNTICQIYLTIIRGTPVVVQVLIYYFIILVSCHDKVLVAVLTFGINSGAYVAEIFRGGIMSVDEGQSEAGRSLGLNYAQTMSYIVIPQAFKNVLPALGNEFIVLLKETAVVGWIALEDLTKAGDIIRGRTYVATLPLIAVAIIYLIVVIILSYFVRLLERRLRNNER